jgi:hypothetical protein
MSGMGARITRTVGVLALVATCGGLAACAGSGERLPQCKGRRVPIHAAAPTATVSPGPGAQESATAVEVDDARGT